MTDVRCSGCGKLLGRFKGQGEMKCRYCKKITEFDTEKGIVRVVIKTETYRTPKK